MRENLGFDVPGADDAQTDEQASAALHEALAAKPNTNIPNIRSKGEDRFASVHRGSNAFVVEGGLSGANVIHAQDLTVPDAVASKLPQDDEPLPTDLKSALEELTRLDNTSATGTAEYLRRRRRNAVAKIAFDLQNGQLPPPIMSANDQAATWGNDPFTYGQDRMAELASKYPQLNS